MFQLDDLEGKKSGGWMQVIAKLVAVSISALASFQFFANYNSGILSDIVPEVFVKFAAGLIGVVMLEGATMFWAHSRQDDSDTDDQLEIAKWAYWVSLITSVSVTVLYFLLTFDLIAPYLEGIKPMINGLAAVILIGIIGFQFVAKTQYDNTAAAGQKNAADSKIRALQNKADMTVREAATRADVAAILANLNRQLPNASARRGLSQSRNILNDRYLRDGNAGADVDPELLNAVMDAMGVVEGENPTRGRNGRG